jgi:succinate-semialdehyde dehydrogenase / glutarate-semialdehyde dehydrogenase
MATIQTINPATGEKLKSYTLHTTQQTSDMIDAAHRAWLSWRNTSFEQRSGLLRNLSNLLLKHKDELAHLMALEMGKPITQGKAEIEKCAAVCTYYADHTQSLLADELVETEASKSFIAFKPLGVVLAVMPWNYPFWQVFRFLAPALAAGNCGVLKHASNVPGCALSIEAMVKQAGFPEHVFSTLLINSSEVEKIIEHAHIKAVTLTGSGLAGSKVAKKAGELIKKTVLELGGSDAYVVLEDADLTLAVKACVEGRLLNNGQSCIAAKRFIVVKPLLEKFTTEFIRLMQAKIVGNPLDEKTECGSLARIDLRDELHQQVQASIHAGAVCALGGTIPDEKTAFYPPTVLTQVAKGMPAFDEELFGPVAAIIEAKDEADAIALANDSPFGLGGAVFTRDVARGEYIAANLMQCGSCFVNDFVKSDPRLPFGGIGQSGYGRELGVFGIREFVNVKTVYIK